MSRVELIEEWGDRGNSRLSRRDIVAAIVRTIVASILIVGISQTSSTGIATAGEPTVSNLQRAKLFLAAGDFRRAIEACQHEIAEHPSAERYVYLTYVYQALDAYAEFLGKTDQWVQMEQLYLNLATGRPEDLVDPPDVLARIAKELIQSAAQKQSDVTAAMATRLDDTLVKRLWIQQTAWRKAHPESWWFGVPPEWAW
jgi:DNA-binding ferritin-like protein